MTANRNSYARRDAFSDAEYHHLVATGCRWQAAAKTPETAWYRKVVCHFVSIMTCTGMRPSEAKSLRWRDIRRTRSGDGLEIVVLSVRNKDKFNDIVAPESVGDHLDGIRAIARATGPDDLVFTTFTGTAADGLYSSKVATLLRQAGLREGRNGLQRSTYCFRHSYAENRLRNGVSIFLLAGQMGTTVKEIEDNYGHVLKIQRAANIINAAGHSDAIDFTPYHWH